MTDKEFAEKLRAAFAVEAGEHVQAMTAGLLELEKRPAATLERSIVETTFREAHTLKGAARSVNRGDIESICQYLESIFASWKAQGLRRTPETFDILNRTIDALARLIQLPEAAIGRNVESGILSDLAALQASAGQTSTAMTLTSELPIAAGRVIAEGSSATAPEAHLATSEMGQQQDNQENPASKGPERVSEETIRIQTSKMDVMLRQAEEMMGLKLIAAERASYIRTVRSALNSWYSEWAKFQEGSAAHRAAGTQYLGAASIEEFLEWNRGFMADMQTQLSGLAKAAASEARVFGMAIDHLLELAKRLIMRPCSAVLDSLPKVVRDLARDLGKEVELVTRGREVEIDKRILEELKVPLMHLVRNAIDHGVESPSARSRAGKPARAILGISIQPREGGKVQIDVSDDGSGIDVPKLKAAAVRLGAISAEAAEILSSEAAHELIFESGTSTSPMVTELSGRGLGMAIIREKVEKLGGQIAVSSQTGRGTSFRIVLPVTLANFKGVLVGCHGETFVIPAANIERITRRRRSEIHTVGKREIIVYEGRPIALVRLDEVLALAPHEARPSDELLEVVVLGSGERRVAFAVDEVLNEQEVLVKSIGAPLVRVRNVAGATILASGRPAIILEAADLLKSAAQVVGPDIQTPGSEAQPQVRKILVADDSVASRMLLKNILESAGYTVTTAVDGMEALTCLRSNPYDLLVSDVEMPRMNGFELTANLRAEPKFAALPVILVTALSSREDRERGMEVGASAYIVKSSFDQTNLLEVVRKLI